MIDVAQGLKRCSKGQNWLPINAFRVVRSTRRGEFIAPACIECERIAARARIAADRDKSRDAARRYAETYPDRVSARHKAWLTKNRDKVNVYQKAYNAQRASEMREYMRAKTKTPEYRAYIQEWIRRNPDKLAANHSRRRARKAGAVHDGTTTRQVLARDGTRCYLCQTDIDPRQITIDHVVPLIRGGSHTADNLRVACRSCNCSKGSRTLEEYQAFLLA